MPRETRPKEKCGMLTISVLSCVLMAWFVLLFRARIRHIFFFLYSEPTLFFTFYTITWTNITLVDRRLQMRPIKIKFESESGLACCSAFVQGTYVRFRPLRWVAVAAAAALSSLISLAFDLHEFRILSAESWPRSPALVLLRYHYTLLRFVKSCFPLQNKFSTLNDLARFRGSEFHFRFFNHITANTSITIIRPQRSAPIIQPFSARPMECGCQIFPPSWFQVAWTLVWAKLEGCAMKWVH